MPSFDLSKLQAVTGPKPVSGTDRNALQSAVVSGGKPANASPVADNGVALEVGKSMEAAQPPVDTDRIAAIRDALRNDSYPLVPTKIADAMIAAQYNFEVKEG